MRRSLAGIFLSFLFLGAAAAASVPTSEDSQTCIECHTAVHPGLVSDWARSRHARVTPAEALRKSKPERRISAGALPDETSGRAVGCAECHTVNADKHKDTFDHNGFRVHIVVTPQDCATCHPTEAGEYEQNLMSYARVNLTGNPLYMDLVHQTNGTQTLEGMRTVTKAPDEETNSDSCYYCHGTQIEVKGTRTVESDMGTMEIPLLSGWPNQGVGRFNPDGSKGACTPCHSRHQFSIAMARKPYTCSECHKGPDVPAYAVYQVSKHGNISASLSGDWDFDAVPWKVGEDFTAPTCAACHVSLIVKGGGEPVIGRTHRMNDRLPWRLFSVIYAHPHPKAPDTSVIRNKEGLPLPT